MRALESGKGLPRVEKKKLQKSFFPVKKNTAVSHNLVACESLPAENAGSQLGTHRFSVPSLAEKPVLCCETWFQWTPDLFRFGGYPRRKRNASGHYGTEGYWFESSGVY